MKLAIISKAAALWKFAFVSYGVGSGLPAVQLATAALRFTAVIRRGIREFHRDDVKDVDRYRRHSRPAPAQPLD
jgi:hypothetical protein